MDMSILKADKNGWKYVGYVSIYLSKMINFELQMMDIELQMIRNMSI